MWWRFIINDRVCSLFARVETAANHVRNWDAADVSKDYLQTYATKRWMGDAVNATVTTVSTKVCKLGWACNYTYYHILANMCL